MSGRLGWTLAVLIAMSMLAACSGEGDDGGSNVDERGGQAAADRDGHGQDEYAAALADKLAGPAIPSFDAEQRACAGSAFVEALGGSGAFQDLGVSVADVENSSTVVELGFDPTDEMASKLGAELVLCDISIGELVLARLEPEAGWVSATPVSSSEDADDEQFVRAFVECIDDALGEQGLGQLFLSDADDHLVEATLGCLVHLEVEEH